MMSVSDRACARRRNDRLAELHQRLGLGADLEAEAQRLPLEAGGDRQHDVGELGRRVHEQVGVNVEIQRRERAPPAQRVGKCEQQVRAEPHEPAHGVGFALQHRAVEILRGDVVPLRRPERTCLHPNGRRHAPRRRQVLAGDRRVGNGGEQHVAAALIE